MMVELAKNAGFCFGVKRAVDMVYENLNTANKIYTYGPIVHNEEVIKEFENAGVRIIEDEEELDRLLADTDEASRKNISIIIRAHGATRKVCDKITKSGANIIDATCPFVKRIHEIVSEASKNGKKIIIIGDSKHPEVLGIVGWCETEPLIFESPEEVLNFKAKPYEELCIVSQTTYNFNKFQYIVEIFKNKGYNVSVVNTICNATQERQQAARDLAKRADVMIVIGGRNSSNTRKLYDICCEECEQTYFIQTLDDLHLELPKADRLVGITAGASTPNKLIEEVQNYVRINF